MVLQQEMGLHSLTIEGLGTLGIRVIIVVITFLRSWPKLKKEQVA
jgi:hypothetical protein